MKRPEKKYKRVIYLIGSLKNENIPVLANKLRKEFGPDVDVFDSWYYPSPDADEWLHKCCKERGLSYKETLQDWGAQHVFEFDKSHLNRATDVVLVMPAGKSGHLELGYSKGLSKRGFVYFENGSPEKVDIMYLFADDLFFSYDELVAGLKSYDTEAKTE